jgi:hypothetical protein
MCFGGLLFRRLYQWQVGRFFRDAGVRGSAHTAADEQFTVSPTAHEAFFGLNRDPRHRPDVAKG